MRPSLLFKPYFRFWSGKHPYNTPDYYYKGLTSVLQSYQCEQFRIHPARACAPLRLREIQKQDKEHVSPTPKGERVLPVEAIQLPNQRFEIEDTPEKRYSLNPLELRIDLKEVRFVDEMGRTVAYFRGKPYAMKYFRLKYLHKPKDLRLFRAWRKQLALARAKFQLPLLRFLNHYTSY